jgi:hypothetical protein
MSGSMQSSISRWERTSPRLNAGTAIARPALPGKEKDFVSERQEFQDDRPTLLLAVHVLHLPVVHLGMKLT